jgi:WD40 repeat protein
MAPEQIQAHPRPASDQYSLGIVVYEWLGGQRPFQGTMTEIAIKHATVVPPSLRFFAPDLPPAVEQVVLMALQKDPHDRFPTALAFAQALERASNQLSRPFAGGFAPASSNEPSTYQLLSSQQYQMQTPAQYGSAQRYGDNSTHPTSQTNGQPLLYPAYPSYPAPQMPSSLPQTGGPLPLQSAYPLYSTNQISSPPQTRRPRPLPKERRMSRRTAIAALAGGATAVIGSSLAYYAYTGSRKGFSGLYRQSGSIGIHSGNPGTSSVTPTVPLMTFNDHTKTIWSVSWSPNGKYIASASDDGTSHVWNASTQKRVFSYRSGVQPAQNDDGAYSIAWMPNSTGIAVGFADGTAQMVDLTRLQQIGSYDSGTGGDLHGSLYAVSISPNGRYVAIAGFFSDDIQIFDVVTQRRVRALSAHTDSVWSLSWSHNGRYIASGSADATARVWDGNSGKLLLIYNKQGDTVRAVSWSPDDSRIVSGGMSGPVYIWASDTGQTLLTYGNQADFEVLAAAWSHNGKYIASAGGSDASTHIWNAQSGQLLRTFPSESINSVSWSPDNSRIVTANNNVVQVWQI